MRPSFRSAPAKPQQRRRRQYPGEQSRSTLNARGASGRSQTADATAIENEDCTAKRRTANSGARDAPYRKFMANCLKNGSRSSNPLCLKYRGRRREAGAASPSADILPRRGAEILRSLFFIVPDEREPMKLEPLSRRRPGASTGTGDVEVRLRCAYRSSTRAGPFDAVIDVVRSRRLMRGARLLLLPALGLLCALFRCLRRLPSLLRHAALLAMSEWRCRPVPAGIANTALGLLQRNKKTSVFAQSGTFEPVPTPYLACCGARATRAASCTTRLRNIARKIFSIAWKHR
jgi:hypothetical protein